MVIKSCSGSSRHRCALHSWLELRYCWADGWFVAYVVQFEIRAIIVSSFRENYYYVSHLTHLFFEDVRGHLVFYRSSAKNSEGIPKNSEGNKTDRMERRTRLVKQWCLASIRIFTVCCYLRLSGNRRKWEGDGCSSLILRRLLGRGRILHQPNRPSKHQPLPNMKKMRRSRTILLPLLVHLQSHLETSALKALMERMRTREMKRRSPNFTLSLINDWPGSFMDGIRFDALEMGYKLEVGSPSWNYILSNRVLIILHTKRFVLLSWNSRIILTKRTLVRSK